MPLLFVDDGIDEGVVDESPFKVIALAGVVDAVFGEEAVGNPAAAGSGASGNVPEVEHGDIVLTAIAQNLVAHFGDIAVGGVVAHGCRHLTADGLF